MKKKSFALALALACFSSFAQAKGGRQPFKIYDFSKGVDTYHSPTTLPDGFVQDSLNGLFDDKAPFTKRAGYSVAWSTKSYSFTGLWTYTDASNTSWQIVRSSDQLTANDLAGHIVKISTVSANNIVGEANAFGNAYFVDQTQGVYYWNASSVTFVGGSPKGSIIVSFHNRLWVIGAAVPNGNQLYGSKYYDGTTWTTGLNDTDPVQYSVGLQDNFDNLTAEYVYLDTLYLFKHYAIYALYGFGQTNASGSQFQISQLTQECGCVDGNTIQTFNGGLKFVSLRGVENFNGYTCTRISDPIKNKIDPAIQLGGFSSQSWVQSVQSDWQAGTFTTSDSLSASITVPSLVLSTAAGSFTDDTNAEFNLGTSSNVSVSNNSVKILTNNVGNIDDNDFEGGSGFSFSGSWTTLLSGATRSQSHTPAGFACTQSPQSGSNYGRVDLNSSITATTAYLIDADAGSTIATTTINLDADCTCGWDTYTLTPAASDVGKRFKIKFLRTLGTYGVISSQGLVLGGPVSFYAHASNCAGWSSFNFDNITLGSSTITSGNFTSQTFDTHVSSSILTGSISISSTSSTEPIATVLQHSSNGSTWSDLTTAVGTPVASNRYLRYLSTFTIGSADNALSTLNSASVSYNFTRSSGAFKSQSHSISGAGSFGNFSVGQSLNSGTIAFSVCSSANSNMIPSVCASQVPNSQITIATNTYVSWYATFTVTNATQTPTLQSGTVQWFSGSNPVPMASTVWDNRYWLSLTTSTTDTANDAVLVLNSRGAWAPFDIHAGGFTQYKGSLYHSDSSATGNIYLDNQAYSDNGNPINVYLNTKNESLGDLAADSYLTAIYPAAINTGACSMTVQYSVDSSTLTYSLGSPTLNEFQSVSAVRLPFPIDSSHQNFGQSIDFTVGTNDNSCAFQFLGLEGYVHTRPVQ